ncbi:MAG: hypothetical protein JWQ14_3299 [Adhaeribacter sp.]|nr:hypothetical protein [Adhaeribacter sp.]
MKENILKILLLVLLLGCSTLSGSFAQTMLPGQNYWVVETNLKQRDYTLVRFYNQNNELLYEERLTGKYLDISRPRYVKRLNLALRQVTRNAVAAVNQKNVIATLYHR